MVGQSPSGSVQEPCASCGEETAVGSVFFSDRLALPRPGLTDVFFCSLCQERIRGSHKPSRWTPEDVASFIRNASALNITWSSRN